MVNKPLPLPLSIKMWNELLLLIQQVYHTWNYDRLWIICSDSSFFPICLLCRLLISKKYLLKTAIIKTNKTGEHCKWSMFQDEYFFCKSDCDRKQWLKLVEHETRWWNLALVILAKGRRKEFWKTFVESIAEKESNKVICKLSQLIPTELQCFGFLLSYSAEKEQTNQSLVRKEHDAISSTFKHPKCTCDSPLDWILPDLGTKTKSNEDVF